MKPDDPRSYEAMVAKLKQTVSDKKLDPDVRESYKEKLTSLESPAGAWDFQKVVVDELREQLQMTLLWIFERSSASEWVSLCAALRINPTKPGGKRS